MKRLRTSVSAARNWVGFHLALCVRLLEVMTEPKRVGYIIRSEIDPARHYTGLTSDLAERLLWHNGSGSGHTRHYRPWSLVVSIEFRTEAAARCFERYLKSGSGRAFAKRHFGDDVNLWTTC